MELYDFQKRGVEYLLKHKYVLCGDDMGLGKTVQAATAAASTGLPWAVVCPAYLKLNWFEDLEKFNIETKLLVGIYSYSSLRNNLSQLSKARYLVADEAHYIKALTSKRSKYLHNVVEEFRPEYLSLLTGTPIKNRISEFYSLLKILSNCPDQTNGVDIRKYYKNEFQFNNTFCNKTSFKVGPNKTKTIYKWYGHKNLHKLKALLRQKYYRRLKDKVLDLPPIISTTHHITEAKDPQLEKAWETFLETGNKNSTAKRESAILKAQGTADYVKELIAQDHSPIVFSDHPDAIETIRDYLESYNIDVGVINADVNPERRNVVVSDFQNGKYAAVLATIGTGSTGFTLTRSSDVVFNDLSWVPADNDQARDRIYRIGQSSKCLIHYMARGHVDEMIINTLKKKLETLKEVL